MYVSHGHRRHHDELLDDLPGEYASLAADLRALIDAGLIRATRGPDRSVRFAVCDEDEAAA
jgi:hypothetical protein